MLYRAFATVGGLTMVSRLLGFIRDILIAAALGTGGVADAFFVAFRFPNLFRRLFGEGAFNAAFVPLFAKKLEGEGRQVATGFASEAMSGLAAILVVFSVAAMLAMPWLMVILAPGFVTDRAKYDLAVALTQITFPYLFCMSLVALLSGVLNSLHRYWAAAAAPILLNLVLISAMSGAIWLGHANTAGAGYILATAVAVAGFTQLAMLWVAVRQAGLRMRFPRPRYSPDMRRLVELGIPGVLAGGITQINIVVGTIIASLQAGAVSYLYYADRLYQLPLGIVGVAIGVVLLPDLARKLRAGERAAVIDSQNRSLEFALLLTLPAAIALAVAAEPIISVLFERGAFTSKDTPATAWALAAFAAGLPAFVMIKVFQPAFFAREDTRTPMIYAAIN
ncbi:MAG: murein biosynthesis integral membrane protein MurJ, partial [Hyphomicrobiaceae bacterium]|nr:murein biosynthesis integral membrane protein MurJ [Hyphomicrobiaceae bacterium]